MARKLTKEEFVDMIQQILSDPRLSEEEKQQVIGDLGGIAIKVPSSPTTTKQSIKGTPVEEMYNPAERAVITPDNVMIYQASSAINFYKMLGMPLLVIGHSGGGMTMITHDITMTTIEAAVEDPYFDLVIFTDGIRATVLKNNISKKGPIC